MYDSIGKHVITKRIQHELELIVTRDMICGRLARTKGNLKSSVHSLHLINGKQTKAQVGVCTGQHVLGRYHRPTQNSN